MSKLYTVILKNSLHSNLNCIASVRVDIFIPESVSRKSHVITLMASTVGYPHTSFIKEYPQGKFPTDTMSLNCK